MKNHRTAAVILAAGKGTRMEHHLPKALVPIAGVPMVIRILDTVEKTTFSTKPVVVVGYKAALVKKAVGDRARFVLQRQTHGTGHAVMVTEPILHGRADQVLVIYGDNPFFRSSTMEGLAQKQRATGAAIVLATSIVPDFRGSRKVFQRFGHIVRDASGRRLTRCVEWKDGTRKERAIRELNLGAYCFDAQWLWQSLPKLHKRNASGEYYLTDLMALAVSEGRLVIPVALKDWREGLGANTVRDIRVAERFLKE